MAEIDACVHQYGADHFRFVDDTFVIQKRWVRELAELIRSRHPGLSFDVLSRADLMTDDLASDLRSMNVRRVYFGMESGSDRVLQRMNKKLTAEQALSAGATVRRHGMEFLSWIMLGYPGEEKGDVLLTRDMLVAMKPDILSISVAFPIRDTPFYDEVSDRVQRKRPLWRRTGENRLVFRGRYSGLFYRFAVRWLHAEVALAKGAYPGWRRPFHRALASLYRIGMGLTGRRRPEGDAGRPDASRGAEERPARTILLEPDPDPQTRAESLGGPRP